MGQAAQHAKDNGVTIFLEHKNSEPAMKILMRNMGMTLHVIHTLRRQGLDNVQVNMDWQHLIMNGENLAEYAALLAAEGLLGHQHANSGWGTFDDDNMVGATAFMETLELAVELRRAGYGARAEEEYPLSLPHPGWAEQDPDDWWRAVERALASLGVEPSSLGLTGQMHGLVLLDASDAVLRPAILWNDQRTSAECEEIEAA